MVIVLIAAFRPIPHSAPVTIRTLLILYGKVDFSCARFNGSPQSYAWMAFQRGWLRALALGLTKIDKITV